MFPAAEDSIRSNLRADDEIADDAEIAIDIIFFFAFYARIPSVLP